MSDIRQRAATICLVAAFFLYIPRNTQKVVVIIKVTKNLVIYSKIVYDKFQLTEF